MKARDLLLLALTGALAGCGRSPPVAIIDSPPAGTTPSDRRVPPGVDWRRMSTPQDRYRLREWHTAWVMAFARARRAGHGAAIAAQGPLFDPDHALDAPMIAPGNYRCRVFKVGANGAAASEFVAYPWFRCRVEQEGEVRSLTKVGGSQRPVGLLFADTPARGIFLGTMMLGDEKRPIDYGRDSGRDMIGIVERVAPGRWRVVLPYPRFESITDVMELVPAE